MGTGEAFGLDDAAKAGFPIAQVKADLARLGADVSPKARFQQLEFPKPGEQVAIIVLDQVADVAHPDYCIEGFCQCVNCMAFCYIGTATGKVVTTGRAYPVCMTCANEMVPPDAGPVEHLRDRRHDEHGH